MDEHKLLTPEEQRDFREWEKGFEGAFWRKLAGELQEELDKAPSALFFAVKSHEELVAARARMQAIAQLLAYPDIIAQKKEALLESRRQQQYDREEDDSVRYL